MSLGVSPLDAERRKYRPRLPTVLARGVAGLEVEAGGPTAAVADADAIRKHFPQTFGRPLLRFRSGGAGGAAKPWRVGVVLSGGQAPGGHNVIAGILDALRGVHGESRLHGFLGGPRGIFTGQHRELTADLVEPYRNSGGFDMIGSGRDKIETPEQLAACRATCEKLGLDALVIIGGDDSNTNAAVLAEYFLEQQLDLSVIGVPKTIDGDLKGGPVEASFGFDTASKVYGELIGNICRDAKSAGKYWHFVKLMGRSASHVTLECALRTRPNLAWIGEEVRKNELTLREIVDRTADVVRRRREAGRSYGVVLVPEGLIEFIPEMRVLIDELNALLALHAGGDAETQRRRAAEQLTAPSAAVLESLPGNIREQLLKDRDSHGNVQVSLIETEALLAVKVAERLGGELKAHKHFFGYEGRCAAPSNFDADYTYGLGHVAVALIAHGATGAMAALRNLSGPHESWEPVGVPLTSLMRIEQRKGKPAPVIEKALVDLEGPVFKTFAAERETWQVEDAYRYPGAIQYFGPAEVADVTTATLRLEQGAD